MDSTDALSRSRCRERRFSNVISNGKSHRRNDTFIDVQFTSLLAKISKNRNYFYAVSISNLLAILSEVFLGIMQENKVGVFSEHSVELARGFQRRGDGFLASWTSSDIFAVANPSLPMQFEV